MKTSELLDSLKQAKDSFKQKTRSRKRKDALKKVLKKLKAKQKQLEEKLANARGDDKMRLKKKRDTVKAHRKKAIHVLKAWKEVPDS